MKNCCKCGTEANHSFKKKQACVNIELIDTIYSLPVCLYDMKASNLGRNTKSEDSALYSCLEICPNFNPSFDAVL